MAACCSVNEYHHLQANCVETGNVHIGYGTNLAFFYILTTYSASVKNAVVVATLKYI